MYKIYCDETWTASNVKVKKGYWVFYGVMLEETYEEILLQDIEKFKKDNGFFQNGKFTEIKWKKVNEGWQRPGTGLIPRYKYFLKNIFFKHLKTKNITFGCLHIEKEEYERVKPEFQLSQPENKHNFFFMLYFQFLFHCFIKTQVKSNPCSIFIDNRNLGGKKGKYNLTKLRDILNKKVYRIYNPPNQKELWYEFQRRFHDVVKLVNLEDSKEKPLIQLSDLCAGFVRYILENQISPPPIKNQNDLFIQNESKLSESAKEELAIYFYKSLREINGYDDINLTKRSWHYRFNVFPFKI